MVSLSLAATAWEVENVSVSRATPRGQLWGTETHVHKESQQPLLFENLPDGAQHAAVKKARQGYEVTQSLWRRPPLGGGGGWGEERRAHHPCSKPSSPGWDAERRFCVTRQKPSGED